MTSDLPTEPPGDARLTPQDNEALYRNGIRRGILSFQQVHQHHALTPRQVYDLLMSLLLDAQHASVWNAGYLMGWTHAYQQRHDLSLLALTPHLHAEQQRQDAIARLLEHVRQGELTLREAATLTERGAGNKADECR